MSVFNSTKPLNIVAVSGGLNHPSKTEALVQAIIDKLGEATPIQVPFTASSYHSACRMIWLPLKQRMH